MSRLTAVLWVPILGCSGGAAECAAGFDLADDGLCYEVGTTPATSDTGTGVPTDDTPTEEPPTLEDVLAGLAPCESTEAGDGELDLDAGCAGGMCAGDTWEDIVAAAGDPLACFPFYVEFDTFVISEVDCVWADGRGASFTDLDRDGVADPGSATYSVTIDLPYEGTTADGLGLDDEISCFLELGEPDYVAFTLTDGEWYASYLSFEAFSLRDDLVNKTGAYGADGFADGAYLYGY